jgi:asparagine synthase (glutamine-hydrolysing)
VSLFVVDEGRGATGEAPLQLRVDDAVVWLDGWTPAGLDALARAVVRDGLGAVAAWPGDWALVSKRDGRDGLTVAVDPFGGRVLYTDGVRVGPSPESLGDLRDRPVDAAGMTVQLSGWIDDPTTTLVQGVWRVPAGFGGWVSASGVRLERIWNPEARPSNRPALAVRAAVEGAIRDRLARLDRPPVVALSGGLDSSVLAGLVAASGSAVSSPAVVSNRFAGWASDEGRWIEAVEAQHGLSSVAVDSRALDPLEVLDLLPPPGFPPVIVNHHLNLALLRAAGGASLWTGFGGDEVFGHGLEILGALVAEGRPLRAAWEAFWLARRFRHVAMSQSRALRVWGSRWARAIRDGEQRETLQRRIEHLTFPLLARSREEQHRLAQRIGASIEMPLLDPRIAEVALGVPTRHLVRRGRTRWVVREAFADLLPREVARRTDKADLSRSLDEPMARRGGDLDIDEAVLAPFRSARAIDACREAAEGGRHAAWCDLFRMVGASRWLEWHTGKRG